MQIEFQSVVLTPPTKELVIINGVELGTISETKPGVWCAVMSMGKHRILANVYPIGFGDTKEAAIADAFKNATEQAHLLLAEIAALELPAGQVSADYPEQAERIHS